MKTISIEALARVEGNGGISATIDGKAVTNVKFTINEGPRLVEKLTVGRTPEEDVSMVPRICAICSISHKNAVLRAMENALSVKVPPKVVLMRELMHMGEMIESHSLHTYYLALPDYVGFPNAIAMASKFDFEVKIALEMKHFGNHIMKLIGGRYIHGENPVIGGYGKLPTEKELQWIKARAIQFMPFVFKTLKLFCELDYPDSPEDETVYACCDPGEDKYGFWGDEILLSTGERIFRDDYKKLTNEFIVSHSFAKRSRFKGKPYSVGALARINIIGERLKKESGKMYKKYFNDHWKKNPLFHTAAQALEILYCFERIPDLVDEIVQYTEDPAIVSYETKDGAGTGLVEAPRGLLIHHHEIKDGLVHHADIITPTAQNAEDIERYCYIAAQNLLDSGAEADQIRDRLELVVRAFDPCVSCSAHMAEVSNAPSNEWKNKVSQIMKKSEPVFIGIGYPDRSDDGIGVQLALELRKHGGNTVMLESEINDDETLWENNADRPLIFLDAVDFQEESGKVTLLSMNHVMNNASLSHKFLPIVSGLMNYKQLKNSYMLGIQPQSIEEGDKISTPVQKAMNTVLEHLIDRRN